MTLKQKLDRLVLIALEEYIYPWYEERYNQKTTAVSKREEIAASIEAALSFTTWIERDHPLSEEYSMIVQQVTAAPVDTGGYVLMVSLVDSHDTSLPELLIDMHEFLTTFMPKDQFTFKDLHS